MTKPKILIYMQGGLIQDIISDIDVNLIVIDTDADDVDAKDHEMLNGQDSYVAFYGVTYDPDYVNATFEEYLDNRKEVLHEQESLGNDQERIL